MDTTTTTEVTRTLTPEACMQKAADILYSPLPSDREVHRAQALVSLGRELRIGGKSKRYAGYSSLEYQVLDYLVEQQGGAIDQPRVDVTEVHNHS